MMQWPTVILEGRKIPRGIFSIQPSASLSQKEISSLMKKVYQIGVWCLDLPSEKHLESYKELKTLVEDENLMGLCHLEVEEGVSFLGKPLHRFEAKVVSTIKKNLLLPDSFRNWPSSSEVFTQREIDRFTFDSPRFDRALSRFSNEASPFLLLGEKYGDWLLALGRIDLLQEMVGRVRGEGFIPIFSGQWVTFSLPKAKSLNVAAYAFPINQKWSLFDLTLACDLIKKFDKPVISLNPLADGKLLRQLEGAFSFLFDGLKIGSAIVEVSSIREGKIIFDVLKGFPSIIPHQRK